MADLRPLPYPFGALAPTLSAETIKEHHDVLQANYVKGWNRGERPTYNAAGIILHELYWDNLVPVGEDVGQPSAQLLSCVQHCFGSPQALVQEMFETGLRIEGSGWVVLAWVPRFERMVILSIEKHQNGWIPTAIPLLVIDCWEHSYYLDYEADRAEYLRLIWHNVNWPVVSHRYEEAVR